MTSNKTDELEMKVAFLEDAIEKLSDEFFAQQKQLSLMQLQQDKLLEQVRSLNENSQQEQMTLNEKPPHY